jgi:hypothetical protein
MRLLWRLKAGDGQSSMAMTGGRSQREKRNGGRQNAPSGIEDKQRGCAG